MLKLLIAAALIALAVITRLPANSAIVFARTTAGANAWTGNQQPVPAFGWWSTLSSEAKDAAVVAAIRGIQIGWAHAYSAGRGDAVNGLIASRRAGDDVSNKTFHAMLDFPSRNPPIFSHPASYYRLAIDRYYAMYPQARAQVFETPLYTCLSDRPIMSCKDSSTHSAP